jgi:hypothetical protein
MMSSCLNFSLSANLLAKFPQSSNLNAGLSRSFSLIFFAISIALSIDIALLDVMNLKATAR